MSKFAKQLMEKIATIVSEEGEDIFCHDSLEQAFFFGEIYTQPDRDEVAEVLEVDSVEPVDSYGGEDQGSSYWSVYKFTKGDQVTYIKFDGWYASYDGATYESMFEVKPVEKVVTFYE